jgi:hypothetical protein
MVESPPFQGGGAGSIPVGATKNDDKKCRPRLSVRTPHFHCGERGSIPLGGTNFFQLN